MDDLSRARDLVAKARWIAVLTGAGVSAESGIPTFRGLGGLWNGRDPMSLATPQAFIADPSVVWEFYNWRRDLVARAEPNPAHAALATLADRIPRLTLITQNVDRLHQRAGSRDVLELHGNLFDVRCTGCTRTFDGTGKSLAPCPGARRVGHFSVPVWSGSGNRFPRTSGNWPKTPFRALRCCSSWVRAPWCTPPLDSWRLRTTRDAP